MQCGHVSGEIMPLPKMNCYYDDDVVSRATREAIYGSPPDPGVYFRVMQ